MSFHVKPERRETGDPNMWLLGYLLEHTRLYVGSFIELFIGALSIERVGKSAVYCTLGLAGGLNKQPRVITPRNSSANKALSEASAHRSFLALRSRGRDESVPHVLGVYQVDAEHYTK